MSLDNMVIELQKLAPAITVLGISLALLFQGFTLCLSEAEDKIKLGRGAVTGGAFLCAVGIIEILAISWSIWGRSSLFSLVAIGIGYGVYFALGKKTCRKR